MPANVPGLNDTDIVPVLGIFVCCPFNCTNCDLLPRTWKVRVTWENGTMGNGVVPVGTRAPLSFIVPFDIRVSFALLPFGNMSFS